MRHLVDAMSTASDKIEPPDFNKHTEWERVYIQSREHNRKLIPGTKYLFCEYSLINLYNNFSYFIIHKRCNDG